MVKKTQNRNGSFLYWSAESWAILTLRLFLSLRFLTAGLGKFKGEEGYSFSKYYDGVVPWIIGEFDRKTNLPGFLVAPYAYAIAYVEIALGLLLILGVKTKYALAATALTYVSLAFGQMLLGDPNGSVTEIGIHILMVGACLFLVRHNKLELLR